MMIVCWNQFLSAAVERFSENGLLDPDAIVKTDVATLANLIKPVSCKCFSLNYKINTSGTFTVYSKAVTTTLLVPEAIHTSKCCYIIIRVNVSR
jgi:hypothetical protein